ncbi:MAG: 50S ribosomal protein L21 [Phycisphaerae bacterium]|nr:50S ribosomal protein L21 [Phycisphaerae bacterium]
MYAIIEDSGQQFRVCEGDVLNVDVRDLAKNTKKIRFDRVLLVRSDSEIKVGTPLVRGAKVEADILNPQAKGKKVYIHRLRRRKASRRRTGHRQKFLQVCIKKIVA